MNTPTIAQQLATASTAGQKAAVTRKINLIVEQARKEGKTERQLTQIRAGFKAAATRFLS